MNHRTSRTLRALCCMASAALCALAGVAGADEAEIFVGTGNPDSADRPHTLLIMDPLGSMDEDVQTQAPYTAATDFPGSSNCDDNRVFYSQGSNSSDPPSCNDSNSVPLASFKCDAG